VLPKEATQIVPVGAGKCNVRRAGGSWCWPGLTARIRCSGSRWKPGGLAFGAPGGYKVAATDRAPGLRFLANGLAFKRAGLHFSETGSRYLQLYAFANADGAVHTPLSRPAGFVGRTPASSNIQGMLIMAQGGQWISDAQEG